MKWSQWKNLLKRPSNVLSCNYYLDAYRCQAESIIQYIGVIWLDSGAEVIDGGLGRVRLFWVLDHRWLQVKSSRGQVVWEQREASIRFNAHTHSYQIFKRVKYQNQIPTIKFANTITSMHQKAIEEYTPNFCGNLWLHIFYCFQFLMFSNASQWSFERKSNDNVRDSFDQFSPTEQSIPTQ